uniref:Uncharacterized protein n=1 Tax=Sphaerodactylus townsendi TaxID=933632 RepID=A0ACB8EJZ9_9SAUR
MAAGNCLYQHSVMWRAVGNQSGPGRQQSEVVIKVAERTVLPLQIAEGGQAPTLVWGRPQLPWRRAATLASLQRSLHLLRRFLRRQPRRLQGTHGVKKPDGPSRKRRASEQEKGAAWAPAARLPLQPASVSRSAEAKVPRDDGSRRSHPSDLQSSG